MTISDEERTRLENEKLKEEKSELEKKLPGLVNEAVDRIKDELIQSGWKTKQS